ncbi:MAG TPA: tRNA (adenosine(37)-N6)-threonylcarbamoyltransferase complex dimerization subunit type 1 TsaB [Gemmataceae bacterium]|nr:tRNA (adenosine(37)-N6)-threonylcarbamoyltransferase complex dimerization subunit type 1 TsaB [Gemmataceae bacterium]
MADFDRVLILETAGPVGQAALAADGRVIAEARLGAERRRASDLAVVVERMLGQAGWKPVTLTAVIVALGPGSYTGLRVGLASAKALAYAVGSKFFGVESFAAIALRTSGEISVIGDALKGELFRRDYRRIGHGLDPMGALEVVSGANWSRGLRPRQRVTGPATALWEGKLPPGVEFVAPDERTPRPVDLLTIAQTCPWAVTTDMWTAEPYYLRGSSAEEKAAGRS